MQIWGVTLSSDKKWHANTTNLVGRAYSRVWILRTLGTNTPELSDVYAHQVVSVLEFAVPRPNLEWEVHY